MGNFEPFEFEEMPPFWWYAAVCIKGAMLIGGLILLLALGHGVASIFGLW